MLVWSNRVYNQHKQLAPFDRGTGLPAGPVADVMGLERADAWSKKIFSMLLDLKVIREP